jgi:hypothetical protein
VPTLSSGDYPLFYKAFFLAKVAKDMGIQARYLSEEIARFDKTRRSVTSPLKTRSATDRAAYNRIYRCCPANALISILNVDGDT